MNKTCTRGFVVICSRGDGGVTQSVFLISSQIAFLPFIFCLSREETRGGKNKSIRIFA